MNIIDLNNLSNNNIKLLHSISKELIDGHHSLVNKIYKMSDQSIDWILNSLLSRDNYSSNVFKDICYVFFVIKISEIETIDVVICQSSAQQKVLNNYLKTQSKKFTVKLNKSALAKLKYFLYPVLYYFINAKITISFLRNKKKGRFDIATKQKAITIIDTFFIDSMFKGNKFHDRYYTDLVEMIPGTELKYCFFFPTILTNKNLKEIILIADNAKEQFIYIFDILELKDYLYALLSPFRIKRIKLNDITFNNVNIGPILKADFNLNISSKSTFIGILNYQLFKALKRENVKIKLVINWYENQIIDKGFNLGKNTYYPNAICKGYQGFVDYHDFHLHLIPTLHEYQTKQTPNEITVISKKIANKIQTFYPYINVSVAPAFRYKYLYNNSLDFASNGSNNFRVLLILPSLNSESIKLLRLVINNLDTLEFKQLRWLIKPHPNRDINTLKDKLPYWPSIFEIIDTSFENAISMCDLLVGNTSSTCMESLARGKPVIISCNDNFTDQNPIPNNIPRSFWALCGNSAEFKTAVRSMLLSKENKKYEVIKKIRMDILADYFEPVTDQGVKKFMNIN